MFQSFFTHLVMCIPGGFTTIIVTTAVLSYMVYHHLSQPKHLPPGPWGLPLLGTLPFIFAHPRKNPNEVIQGWSKKFGDIWSMKLGSEVGVMLSNWTVAKEAFVDQGDHTSHKQLMKDMIEMFDGAGGIVHGNGLTWKEQRRFTLKSLRGLGMGSAVIEKRIKTEFCSLLDLFDLQNQKPFYYERYINLAAANVISSIIYNKRFDLNDKAFNDLMKSVIEKIFEGTGGPLTPINYLPWLRHLPGVRRRVKSIRGACVDIKDYLVSHIKRHYEMHDYESDLTTDYIDDYIREKKKRDEMLDSNAHFTEKEFHKTLFDVFCGGIETVSTTFSWYIVLLVLRRDVQRKLQDEIDSVVGKNTAFMYNDRKKMPYVEAFCHEAQRLGNIGLCTFRRIVTTDITLKGYNIPAGTNIFVNVYGLHIDPEYWPEPTSLKPERWLDAEGRFQLKTESFIPFSLGRRTCIGEPIGKMELFFFTVLMLQRFTIKLANGEHASSNDYTFGMTFRPKPFKIIAEPR